MKKFDLSLRYFPHSTSPRIARQHLMRWITNARGLPLALSTIGYRKTQKHFTEQQVEMIMDYLGEP